MSATRAQSCIVIWALVKVWYSGCDDAVTMRCANENNPTHMVCVHVKMINVSEIISLWRGRTLILKSRANYILLAVRYTVSGRFCRVSFAENSEAIWTDSRFPDYIFMASPTRFKFDFIALHIFYPMHKYGESKSVVEYSAVCMSYCRDRDICFAEK